MAIAAPCLQAIVRHAVDLVLRQCEASLFRPAYVEALKYMVSKSTVTIVKRFASPQEEHLIPAMKASEYNERIVLAKTIYTILCFEEMIKENLDDYHGLNWQSRFKIVKGICTFLDDIWELANIHLKRNMMPKITYIGFRGTLWTQVSIPVGTNADKIHRLLCFEYVPMGNLGLYLLDEYLGFEMSKTTNSKGLKMYMGNIVISQLEQFIIPALRSQQPHGCTSFRELSSSSTAKEAMAIAAPCLQAIVRHAVDLVLRQCEASLFRAADRVSQSIITMVNFLKEINVDNKRFALSQEEYGTPAETIHRLFRFVHVLKKYLDEYHRLNWQSRFNKVNEIRTFLEDLDRQLLEQLDIIFLNRNMMPKITDFGLPMSLGRKVNIPMGTNADKIHRLLCFEYVPARNLGMYLPDDFCGLHWPTHHYNMDLKPGNVLLHENIVPKLTDFGLAKCFGGERTQIIEGGSIGTLWYMDPEYIKHGNKISYKSDVYSFGVTLLEIVARKAGYSKRSEMSSEEFTEIDILNSANGMTASTSILERTRGESTYVRLAGLSPPNPDNVEDDFRATLLLDSGASMHVVGNARLLHDYSSLPDGMEVVGKGTVKLGSFIIPNVYLVEGLDTILISVNQLDRDHKLCSFFGGVICIVRHQVNRLCLSYGDLATQLKQLYLYSVLFPKGTGTPRDAVIGMWIREGFIQPSGNSHDDDRLENVVVEYYLGLIKRNLIQPFPEKYCLTDGMSTLPSFAEYMAMLNISSCLETWKSTEATSSTVSPIQRAVLSFIFIAAIVAVNTIAQSMVLLLNSGGRALAAAASMHQQLSRNNLTDERSDKPRSNRAPQTNSSDDRARAPMENKLTEDEAENHSDPNSCVAERDIIEKAKRSGEWYVATGAAHHATGNPDLITNMLELENGGLSVQAADGTPMPVCGRGNVVTDAVVLPDVYYVPGLCTNLVSVGQLAGFDYSVGFGRGNCIVSSPDGTVVGGAHARGDGLYEVDFLRVPLDIL